VAVQRERKTIKGEPFKLHGIIEKVQDRLKNRNSAYLKRQVLKNNNHAKGGAIFYRSIHKKPSVLILVETIRKSHAGVG